MARRSGLGKGLSALIPPGPTGDSGASLREVPIANIRPNPRQPRTSFDEDTMASLSASIKELGVLQPVLVRRADGGADDEFELIAGERRWRAARRAGLQMIPVLVQEVDEANSLEKALVENLHRQDLNALEEAAAYQQLIEEFGLTHDQVAKRVGKSRSVVSNTLRLMQLPTGVQRLLVEGQITTGHARALLGTPDRGLQEQLAKSAAAEELTVRAVEELVRRSVTHEADEADEVDEADGRVGESGPVGTLPTPPGPGPTRPGSVRLPPPGILELEELLSGYLNTRVKVDLTARRGKVVVEFATLEDLERIYKLMVGRTDPPNGHVG